MAFQIQIEDLTLDGTSRWEESQPSRVPVDTFPRRQGAVVPLAPLKGPKTGRFDFIVQKDTEAELLAYLDDLRAVLERGQSNVYLRNDNRCLRAIKTNFVLVHQASQIPSLCASGYIECIIPDPFWYSVSGEQIDYRANIGTSPFNFSIANAGGAACYPRIEITALSTNKTGTFKVLNNSTSLFTQWGSGTINATKILKINCDADPFTVTNDGADALGSFTGSRFFSLLPVSDGGNSLTYTGPTGVDLKIYWVERWD